MKTSNEIIKTAGQLFDDLNIEEATEKRKLIFITKLLAAQYDKLKAHIEETEKIIFEKL